MCFLNSFIESKNHVNVSVHKIKLLWSISLWAKWQKDDIKRANGLDIKVGSHYEKGTWSLHWGTLWRSANQHNQRLLWPAAPAAFRTFRRNFSFSISEKQLVGRGLRMWEWRQQLIWLCGGQPHSPTPTYYWLSRPHINNTQYTQPPTKLRHCYVMCFGIVRSLVCHTLWV